MIGDAVDLFHIISITSHWGNADGIVRMMRFAGKVNLMVRYQEGPMSVATRELPKKNPISQLRYRRCSIFGDGMPSNVENLR